MKKGKKSDYDLNMNDYSQIYDYNLINLRLKTQLFTFADWILSANSNQPAMATASARHADSGESSDNDTSAEFNRLSDILQSRGLPSHIVNAFGSKVTN